MTLPTPKSVTTSPTPLPDADGYGQVCPMALALDEVGGRWTLLVLRDLARAPLRFSDLAALNPGISPTVLTARLKRLQTAGLIEQQTARGPGRGSVYVLAHEARSAINAALTGLTELGAFLLDVNPPQVDPAHAFAAQLRLNARFVMARQSTLEGVFTFDFGAWQNHIIIDGTAMTIPIDPPEQTLDAVATFTPPTTLMRVTGGAQTIESAEAEGQLTISGDREAMNELLRLLAIEAG